MTLTGGVEGLASVERALVICAHPDDEAIAMGGTIRKLANQGTEVTVLMFADGNEGYTDISDKDRIVAVRRKEREQAGAVLGVQHYEAYDYTDYGVPADQWTYKRCIEAIRRYRPQVIFTHYWAEYMAHRAVATVATEAWWQAGWHCSMELGEPWRASALFHFETIHPLPEVSDIVDISETFESKKQAMQAYASQHRVVSSVLRQIDGLATYRGALVGVPYGEAFVRSRAVPQLRTFREI